MIYNLFFSDFYINSIIALDSNCIMITPIGSPVGPNNSAHNKINT